MPQVSSPAVILAGYFFHGQPILACNKQSPDSSIHIFCDYKSLQECILNSITKNSLSEDGYLTSYLVSNGMDICLRLMLPGHFFSLGTQRNTAVFYKLLIISNEIVALISICVGQSICSDFS